MKFSNDSANPNVDAVKILEMAIVEQVKTFGLTTRTAWSDSTIDPSLTPHDVSSTLRKLTSQGNLESHPLHHGRHYFTLTKSEAKRIGCQTTTGGPFHERSKFRAYAKLLIGLSHLPNAKPLRADVKLQVLGPASIGLPDNMMITSEGSKIYWLRIDASIRAAPSRTAQQFRTDIFRIVKIDSICELIQKKKFELVLVTCTQARSDAILKHFQSYDRVGASPIRTIIIPELIPLITSVQLGGLSRPSKTPL